MFLDDDELIELTQRRRRDAQIRMLLAMGIEHRVRPDGSVAVHKAHVDRVFGVTEQPLRRAPRDVEPDWSRL